MNLPEPAHEMGYTDSQLKETLTTVQYVDLMEWMRGQTVTMSESGEMVVYSWDVERWAAGRPVVD